MDRVRGGNAVLDRHGEMLRQRLLGGRIVESDARHLVEQLALALQAAVLVGAGNSTVADGFCASRLDGGRGQVFGTLPASVNLEALVDRAFPG